MAGNPSGGYRLVPPCGWTALTRRIEMLPESDDTLKAVREVTNCGDVNFFFDAQTTDETGSKRTCPCPGARYRTFACAAAPMASCPPTTPPLLQPLPSPSCRWTCSPSSPKRMRTSRGRRVHQRKYSTHARGLPLMRTSSEAALAMRTTLYYSRSIRACMPSPTAPWLRIRWPLTAPSLRTAKLFFPWRLWNPPPEIRPRLRQ